ncbi:MAG: hypothetical protein AAF604_24315 [Acidobacteriota bacterium]
MVPRRLSFGWLWFLTFAVVLVVPPYASAQICGHDRVEEISPGVIYKVVSPSWSLDIEINGSNLYVFKLAAGPTGTPRVVVFGLGNGDGSGPGSDDFFAYTGRRPMTEASLDLAGVLAVIDNPSCFGLDSGAKPSVDTRLIAQHAHLDHANQEMVEAVKASALRFQAAHYHVRDHQLLTCEGSYEGQELEDTLNCGFQFDGPEDQNPFRGHPYRLTIQSADWQPLGSANDPECQTLLSFNLADGRQVRIEADRGHTPGGLVLVVDPQAGHGGLAFLSTTRGASHCRYPGYWELEPHNFS